MAPESFYDPCNAITTITIARHKFLSTDPHFEGRTIYIDVLPTFEHQGLAQSAASHCYLNKVDNNSRKPRLVDQTLIITTVNDITPHAITQSLSNTQL
jgi:hypothetical protein